MKCWFCEFKEMRPVDGQPHWYQCPACWATETDKPTLPGDVAARYGTVGADGKRRMKPKGSKVK